MKIGFDAKRFFHNATGLGNYSRDLIRIMSCFYPQNNYFLYNPKPKSIDRTFIDGKIIVEKLFSGNRLFANLWRLFFIKNELIQDKIDIFHGLSGEIPVGLKSTNIKTIVTIHDVIFLRYPKLYFFIDRKIYFWKFRYAANNADVVIAISEQTKRDIIDFLKISPNKIIVIYQGCSAVFKKTATIEEMNLVQEKYQLPQKFILNVGTIEERKNIFSVVKAIQNTDIKLVIVGKKTKYYQQISAFLVEKEMQNQVIFLENIPLNELSWLYQLATIFVYPSVFEGFGIPIIEALYSKTPVISSGGSCFAEAGGKDSIYVAINDLATLKAEILTLWNDASKRKAQAEKGFEYVQKFDDELLANQWNMVYKNLIDE